MQITFKQFLHEAKPGGSRDDALEQLAELIAEKCGPWLAAGGSSDLVYRGVFSHWGPSTKDIVLPALKNTAFSEVILEIDTNKNRRPTDSPDWLHDAMNDALRDVTGSPMRTDSVFVTGSQDNALEYGTMYLVFPIGKVDYAWSPQLVDATSELYLKVMDGFNLPANTAAAAGISKIFREHVESKPIYKNVVDQISDDLSNVVWTRSFLTRAYRNANSRLFNDLLEDNGAWAYAVTKYLKDAKPWSYNTGLADAIKSKHEIMLRCDKYLMVSSTFVDGRRAALMSHLKKRHG